MVCQEMLPAVTASPEKSKNCGTGDVLNLIPAMGETDAREPFPFPGSIFPEKPIFRLYQYTVMQGDQG